MLAFLLCFQMYGPNSKFELFAAQNPSTNTISDLNELLFYCRPALEEELDKKNFLDPSWTSSIVKTRGNKTFNVEGRYNLIKDDVQILINDKPYILFGSKVDAVIIGQQEFIYSIFIEDDREKEGYLKRLVTGRRSLFSRSAKSSKGQLETYYYSSIKEELPVRLNTKKKELLKLLKDRKLPLYHYIQIHKLKPSVDKDLVQIFEHYNTL
ncbi:MAG: hypothetical protein AAGG75_21435 [Bacteroidota bacterium]